MGYNTTLVILNDALDAIEKDPTFGNSIAKAIRSMGKKSIMRVDISSGYHFNAAHVVESHHSNETSFVTVGGNLGVCRAIAPGWEGTSEDQKAMVDNWAEKLGYKLVPITIH